MSDQAIEQSDPAAEGAVKPRPPGYPDVWILICGDMFFFLVYFTVFTVGRIGSPELFEQGRQYLNPALGFVNTLVLLTSSWFVVRAVMAASERRADRVTRNLLVAMGLGVIFVVAKVLGYVHDASIGDVITTNPFFSYYFAITGVHLLHVLIGLGILAVCVVKARGAAINEKYVLFIESGASFWHMVDLLWVVLFPMFYLLRGP